ncbi:ATP-binding protein [Stenotrophomonas pictorum]|uniref:ATP-binding protein n=1 Tax=Stenotrophomonas pictorum TaxID=86184 RepID=UPI0006D0D9CF|nr:ATP-binding protein [Stenotrophomonas pictorum]
MATTCQELNRTFFDLPTDENTQIETAELLADLAIGGRADWSTLLDSERILIVSEAGMGKTYECQRQQQRLWEEGRSAFFVELATLATDPLERQFSTEERQRFDNWKVAQTERAFFFLDSVDELKLTQRSFETTLKQFAATLGDNLERTCIVLTTRPTTFDLNVVRKRLPVQPPLDVFVPEDYFANVAMSVNKDKSVKRSTPEWRFVALSALDAKQMRALAVAQGVGDPDELLDAVNAHHAYDFAKRPLDFLELCGDWKLHGRIRTHREQVDSSIDIKLRARGDRPERTQLPPQRVRDGAARLALACLLSRKFTLWHSSDDDRGRGDAPLDPAKILDDWSDDEVKTLLERPLFGFATYGRVRFHNRSIVEFLAAERLKLLVDRGLPIRALMRLLFATTPEGQRIVKPSLQPVVAWLAPHISTVRAELLDHEPSVLLRHGDPGSLNLTLRTQALERYVHMYGAGGWRGQGIPNLQVQRLATNDLNEVIASLWAGGVRNPEVRETLLELIGAGQMTGCADIAYGVATDPDNDARDRLNGLLALAELQDSRLSALLDLIAVSSPDWPEDLAQSVIYHLFPRHLSVPQLVKTLARLSPKLREIGGISTMLPLAIAKAKLEPTAWAELQHRLAELVSNSCRWHDQHYRVTSGRQDLVPALLVASRRRLEMGETGSDLFDAVALAGLLAKSDHDATEDTKTLRLSSPPRQARFAPTCSGPVTVWSESTTQRTTANLSFASISSSCMVHTKSNFKRMPTGF